jgi:bifunctional DNA-binding transcriptional regulator/antitoxin component of YhaV-PrlF toxin-antitoxin module
MAMLVKVTSKRQVTFPRSVLDASGVGPGDHLELMESPNGFILRPRRTDLSLLAGLRDKIDPNAEPFDIRKFRDEGYDPAAYRH